MLLLLCIKMNGLVSAAENKVILTRKVIISFICFLSETQKGEVAYIFSVGLTGLNLNVFSRHPDIHASENGLL